MNAKPVLVGLAMALLCAIAAAAAPWRPSETVTYAGYRIALEDRRNPREEDDAPRLRVIGSGTYALTVTLEGGIVPLNDGLVMSKRLARDNVLSSRNLYVSPHLKDARGAPMLIVLGQAFASDPGSIAVVTLAANGKPVLALKLENFEPDAIADLDGDGIFELIGSPSYAQMSGNCLKTYDPFAVYRVAGPTLRYDIRLSEAYNRKHYYGWAGPKAREDVLVVLCGKYRGRILDRARAEALGLK